MFTGIIGEVGKLSSIEIHNGKKYLTINCNTMQSDLLIGDSIACDGICLTVVKYTNTNITVEVMNQTLQITTARLWRQNKLINLERALAVNDRLNGHIVQGHIDTIATVKRKYFDNNTLYIEFVLPPNPEFYPLMVIHGSICIDGVSLTIARLINNSFQVALIRHTISMTHFNDLSIGDSVNIEFDILGKYIQKNMKNNKSGVTEEWLINNGF